MGKNPPSAYCLLPSAFCFLPSAFCFLPSAFCFLPAAFRFPPKALLQTCLAKGCPWDPTPPSIFAWLPDGRPSGPTRLVRH